MKNLLHYHNSIHPRNVLKFYLLTILLFLFPSCKNDLYYGVVYDFENKRPIGGVEINDYLNSIQTVSDSTGYFSLTQRGTVSGRLIFKKTGYTTDTLETISIKSGEQYIERFKGDTVYLFSNNSNFRDSIARLNSAPTPSVKAYNSQFTGDWSYQSQDTGEVSSSFELYLRAKEESISGRYCAVSRGGRKIDCVEAGDPDNISGYIKNDTAYVRIKGSFDPKASGNAIIYFKNNVLVWEFLNGNTNGEFYLPLRAELQK